LRGGNDVKKNNNNNNPINPINPKRPVNNMPPPPPAKDPDVWDPPSKKTDNK
jgi:katanin p60 ATPase-containing subunit A1